MRRSLHSRIPRSLSAAIACAVGIACSAGCSIRYDAAGLTRVGIGLWGFGDPPGVQWNLDAPRREIPELPAAPRPVLPPRTMPGSSSNDAQLPLPRANAFDRTEVPVGEMPVEQVPVGHNEDNHDRASRRLTDIECPLALRACNRAPDTVRG
jgi:hypothetical protein